MAMFEKSLNLLKSLPLSKSAYKMHLKESIEHGHSRGIAVAWRRLEAMGKLDVDDVQSVHKWISTMEADGKTDEIKFMKDSVIRKLTQMMPDMKDALNRTRLEESTSLADQIRSLIVTNDQSWIDIDKKWTRDALERLDAKLEPLKQS